MVQLTPNLALTYAEFGHKHHEEFEKYFAKGGSLNAVTETFISKIEGGQATEATACNFKNCIQAKKDFYEKTSLGRMASIFQSVKSIFGVQTSLEKAQAVLTRIKHTKA